MFWVDARRPDKTQDIDFATWLYIVYLFAHNNNNIFVRI